MTADELRAAIDDPDTRGDIPAAELTEAILSRIDELQPLLNAFITVTPEVARADARRADDARRRGEPLPLDGMPIAVKDNIDVGGVRTTVASKFFEDFVPAQDAEVVRRLRAAGAVIVGKAFLHEFVFGATCNNPFYGQCRNPWDTDRIPGGSSGGSGAALAADMCIGALGSDTGGSVRIPAHLNGVSALRATFGTVSNRGAFPISWSFDTIGPMARSARDVAALFEHMVGFDVHDPRAVEHPLLEPLADVDRGIEGVRVGLPRGFFFDGLESEIERFVRAMADALEGLGARVEEIDVPRAEEAKHVCTRMIWADALAMHRDRYDHQRERFGKDIARRLALGETISGTEYAEMTERMAAWRRDMRVLFAEGVDLVLTPTANVVAPLIDEAEMIATTVQLTRFTYPWSLAHMPAISLPVGITEAQGPAGWRPARAAQYDEPLLLRAGIAYHEVTDCHRRRPAALSATAA